MTYSCLEIHVNQGIAHVRLNRPAESNSLLPAFWQELPEAIARLDDDGQTRALVLSSTGRHFSSGMDRSVFQRDDGLISTATALDRDALRRLIGKLQKAVSILEQCRMPVIAAIQGGCIGGAFAVVCACDIRFATSDAFFCIYEINIGIMSDLGTLQRLPRLIPEAVVRELAYTGSRLPADRARAVGLVNEVFEDHDEMVAHALAVAGEIAERSPLAVAASKEALNFARDHSLADGLQHAAALQASIFDRQHILESFQAQLEKRKPSFDDLLPIPSGL